MPGPPPLWPLIQLGALQAYIDRELGDQVQLKTYSGHLSILAGAFGVRTNREFETYTEHGEYVYALLYLRRFVLGRRRGALDDLLRRVNRGRRKKLSWSKLDRLERATRTFVEHTIGPNLRANRTNIVCFTLSYDQLYGSLYCARALESCFSDKRFLFVYGGFRASNPNTAAILRAVAARGLLVSGEGERPLARLLSEVAAFERAGTVPKDTPELLADQLAKPEQGVFRIAEPFDFRLPDAAMAKSQVRELQSLPVPDYTEFFRTARKHMRSQGEFESWRLHVPIPMEGSRGCFGRCDFCNFRLGWAGFRRHDPTEVFARAAAALRRYGSQRLAFCDYACDTWAEAYADETLRQGLSFQAFLETRAHHGEDYWIKLALSGVTMLQFGAEAVVTRLLRVLRKDTMAIQNLVAQKCLTEMGVRSGTNLITHHPGSTLADVAETRRVLGLIGHFQPFALSRFVLMAGSPLYEGLTEIQRKDLKRQGASRFPPALQRYEASLGFAAPESLGPSREVRRAWDSFCAWFQRPRTASSLHVTRLAESDLVITRRLGQRLESHRLQGAEALVYDACHAGLQAERIVARTGLDATEVAAALARAVERKLMLKVDEFHLSLALRPRHELVTRALQRLPSAQGGAERPQPARASNPVPQWVGPSIHPRLDASR